MNYICVQRPLVVSFTNGLLCRINLQLTRFKMCATPSSGEFHKFLTKGWLPRAKLKKIQEGIVGFGCNFGGMIAHLYGSHSPGYTQIKQG